VPRPLRTVATACAVLALTALSACSSSEPPAPGPAIPPTGSAPAEPAPGGGEVSQEQRARFGAAHQGALALIALGGLGEQQGVSADVRSLGADVAANGRALDEQIRVIATEQGVVLGDQLGAEAQALVADLQARSGEPFDQAWLRAVLDLEQQARDAANAVLASSEASEQAKAAARDALAQLDAAATRLEQAASAAGAATPDAVDAGSGGQAADGMPGGPAALLGGGLALLGVAGWLLRRRPT
jgi:predicted outer membrane protein